MKPRRHNQTVSLPFKLVDTDGYYISQTDRILMVLKIEWFNRYLTTVNLTDEVPIEYLDTIFAFGRQLKLPMKTDVTAIYRDGIRCYRHSNEDLVTNLDFKTMIDQTFGSNFVKLQP